MYLGRRGGDGKAIDGASSGVGLQQGGKDLDESGFAGTVGAKQGENAACGNLTVDTAQHLRALVRLVYARTWIMGPGRSWHLRLRHRTLDRCTQPGPLLPDPAAAAVVVHK